MFLILLAHILSPVGLLLAKSTQPTLESFIITGIPGLGSLGNALFFMIAGYFASKQRVKLRRLIKVMVPLWFYSVLFYMFPVILHIDGTYEQNLGLVDTLIYFIAPSGFIIGYVFMQFISIRILPKYLNLSNNKKNNYCSYSLFRRLCCSILFCTFYFCISIIACFHLPRNSFVRNSILLGVPGRSLTRSSPNSNR
jgi:hypothetical protein